MDNKVTKSRLSNFLSYEWIVMIALVVAAIFVWEFVYTVSAVRLSVGQQFKYYYDQNISTTGMDDFYDLITNKNTFSYDVLKFDREGLTAENNVLSIRLSIQEGDAIFTDNVVRYDSEEDKVGTVRSAEVVDAFSMYDLSELLKDAESYLSQFLLDGQTELKYENMDKAKIESHFLTRMKKDNRYRKEADKKTGVEQECQRIEKLCKEVADFKTVLSYNDDALFYRYTKYTQSKNRATKEKDKADYEYLLNREIEQGRENAIYGINIGALPVGDKTQPSKYVKVVGATDASNVVLMVFNFRNEQPELQFETISFINTMIRECSTILG